MGFELVTAFRMEEFKPLSYSDVTPMRLTKGLQLPKMHLFLMIACCVLHYLKILFIEQNEPFFIRDKSII